MPFTLRRSDYDCLSDDVPPESLSSYQKMIVQCLPHWADTVQSMHSDNASMPTRGNLDKLAHLVQECKSIAPLTPGSYTSQGETAMSSAVRSTFLETLNHRLLLVIDTCQLDFCDVEAYTQSTTRILNSAVATLEYQAKINPLLNLSLIHI